MATWSSLSKQQAGRAQFLHSADGSEPDGNVPPLHQNNFGVEFDGPVYIPKLYNGKDKTFFMASYEGYRLVQQSTALSTELPPVFFTGNFSSRGHHHQGSAGR